MGISFGIPDELHVLDDSAFPVVVKSVLDAFLPDKASPVQLALADCINFFATVVNGLHHVVQVLVRNMSGFHLVSLDVILFAPLIKALHRIFAFYSFQLSSLLIQDVFFACECDALVGLY